MKKFVSAILSLCIVCLAMAGCQTNSNGPSALDTDFIYSSCQGTLKNSEGKSLTFDGSDLGGDMACKLNQEATEESPETRVAIPASKQLVVESGGDSLDVIIGQSYKSIHVKGIGIAKAELNEGGKVQLSGEMKSFYVSISMPERFHLGDGLFKVSGTDAKDVTAAPNDTGFDLSGVSGYISLEITSSENSGVSFIKNVEVSGPECSVDLSRYSEGVVVVTDGSGTQEIQF